MRAGPGKSRDKSVFLNAPYDETFRSLFLAYVTAICSFGLTPRTTLEVEGGEQRLRRIASLIDSCRLSFHDLSRVELDSSEPATPRFNMPFEAGLAVMSSLATSSSHHTYFIFEADPRRLQKSLSDLNGSDVYCHAGTPEGVLREVSNALIRAKRRPTVKEMRSTVERVKKGLEVILLDNEALTIYQPRVFSQLVTMTNELIGQQVPNRRLRETQS